MKGCLVLDEPKSMVGNKPSIIKPFVDSLFLDLDSSKICWAVMRGWERLPEWTRYDVDILVSRHDEKRAVDIAKKVAEATGWTVYGVFKFGLMTSIWMCQNGNDGQSYLRIDIELGNSYRGIEIHESQRYLSERVWEEKQKLWRMPDGYAAAAVLLKELAVSGEVDTDKRRAQVLTGLEDPQFEAIVKDALQDDSLLDKLMELLARADWNGVKTIGPRVKARLFRKTPINIIRMCLYGFSMIRSLFHPFMRCLIVIVGPDGCGKTTIADAIVDRFNCRPFQSVRRVHMLFGVPRMREIKAFMYSCIGRKLPPQKEDVPGSKHIGMQPPHSTLRAMMYVTYYGLGMICGRIKLLLWRSQGGLMLADRFFQDYYYMRGYMKCPRWYIRLMEVFAPKPDLLISLMRPAEDIYSQKPELSIEEIKREQDVITCCFGCRKNARIVDASKGIATTVDSVVHEIESWIATRGPVNGLA